MKKILLMAFTITLFAGFAPEDPDGKPAGTARYQIVVVPKLEMVAQAEVLGEHPRPAQFGTSSDVLRIDTWTGRTWRFVSPHWIPVWEFNEGREPTTK